MGTIRRLRREQGLVRNDENEDIRIVDLTYNSISAGAGPSKRAARAKRKGGTETGVNGSSNRRKRRSTRVRRDDDSDDDDDERGKGGEDGAVLDMTLIGDSIYSPNYVVQVSVGSSNQSFYLQVDTGSSDLWIASNQCSTAPCTNNKPPTYNPSSSGTNTNVPFDIDYLSGQVAGPIIWDSFALGPYEIGNQALAAATTVVNESLSSQFSGILGLALPLNSVIQQRLPAGVADGPDGATFMSNLFGTSPASQAPAQNFFSLLLERPGTDRIPSLLGIGRHPSGSLLGDDLEIDKDKIQYSGLVSENNGVHYWKAEMRAITVYVNGTRKEVDIGNSVSGSVFPEAILDTGVPYIIATPDIANAVWGAIGISPASDGNYYLPCTTPLNMTITLDNRTEIPLHPLDLSAVSTSGSLCVGLVQQNAALRSFGDIILGVPFLRNVYTVMAYEPASSDGIIGNAGDVRNGEINPQLGLLNLTDPTTALEEFHKVRVLNQPLGSSNQAQLSSGEKLSVGVKVLFGLIGFFVLCGILFGVRYFLQRRQDKRRAATAGSGGEKEPDKEGIVLTRYDLVPLRAHSYVPSEDTQRTLTNIADPTSRLDKKYESIATKAGTVDGDEELGYRKSRKFFDSEGSSDENEHPRDRPRLGDDNWEPHSSWIDPYSEFQEPILGEWRPPPPTHERSYSSSSAHSIHAPSAPLLNQFNANTTNHNRNASADSTGSGDRTPTQRRVSTLPIMPLERNVDEFGGLVIDYSAEGMTMPGSGPRRPRPQRANFTEPVFRASHPSDASNSNFSQASPSLPRPRRTITGPRPASTMSRVINADDVS